ncbi:sulfite exporter TauE/SafE family protein [Acinetobacter rathckeae]|uniref:sulfite exporter TauE/SafE family protein n=1 Tax=Acinetobacter rathckeae TaxID=2605272 RepID=UPI0018A25AF3|nr:sulfite exporter TauE/SafE family protein [Acinetobacter rathckeae]MBF7688669.1 sulfite exporter TauE/SafE family protein [Acinetobacter rathckeae]
MDILIYFLIGGIAGFTAGLFGVGGGLIIVPILYVVFQQQGYPLNVIMHLALGTSLATILVTSISSILAHHKKNAVLWPVVKNLSFGLCLGSFFGAGIAGILSGYVLQFLVGIFALTIAYTMFNARKTIVDERKTKTLPSLKNQLGAGAVIGIASAIFGIGGGSLTVPYLNRCGIVMQKAVATSAACGFPIALAGALGFMWFGKSQVVELPHTLGYVHIYAFIGISSMSFLTAKIGAKVAHQLSPQRLKICFSFLLLGIGSYFILKAVQGIF